MPSRKISDLHPLLQVAYKDALVLWVQVYPQLPVPFLTCTHRPNTEQTALYAQGRTKPGKVVTNAKKGQSPHNFLPALAFDIAFQDKERMWEVGLFEKFAGIIEQVSDSVLWGGRFQSFVDRPHFELKNWKKYIK